MLTTGEKLGIIHDAIVKQLPWKDICKEHRVSMSTIGILVGKAKGKPEFLADIHSKEEAWSAKEAAITIAVDQLIEEDSFIDSC
jgi:hypothetical protein